MSDVDGVPLADMEPLYTLSQQEFYVLHRKVAYAPLLRSLRDGGPRPAAGGGEGLAALALDLHHGWTCRGADWCWEITQAGLDALEAYEAKRVAR